MSKDQIAKERMWLNADRTALVGEGDPEAATLYAAVGTLIRESAVKQFKITGGYLSKESKAKAKAEDKAQAKAEDKAKAAVGDEGGNPKGGLTVTRSSTRAGKRPVAKAK